MTRCRCGPSYSLQAALQPDALWWPANNMLDNGTGRTRTHRSPSSTGEAWWGGRQWRASAAGCHSRRFVRLPGPQSCRSLGTAKTSCTPTAAHRGGPVLLGAAPLPGWPSHSCSWQPMQRLRAEERGEGGLTRPTSPAPSAQQKDSQAPHERWQLGGTWSCCTCWSTPGAAGWALRLGGCTCTGRCQQPQQGLA